MRVSPCPLPSVVASSSYTVSAEGYPDYTANAITSDEAAAAYREAAAGDADGSGNVGGTSTASQTTTVSSNDIASTEHEFLVLGLIPKVKNTITLTITDTDGNLKAQYKMVLSSGCICRVYQYGFRGFYFAWGLASTSLPMPILQRPIPICYRFAASYLRRIRSS